MKAEILSIGTELLLGQIENTNASYLAGQLPRLGLDLYWITVVGDNHARLAEAFRRAWERSEVIVTTGGLGPTEGDLTREAVGRFLGEKPVVVNEMLEYVKKFFTSRGLDMPSNNAKQAMLIPSARAVPNPLGTAPGWWVEKDGHHIICLPGPPHELQAMWEKVIFPQLQQRLGDVIYSLTLKTAGLGESKIDELLRPWLGAANPTLATYAKMDGVHLRITAKAAGLAQAAALVGGREAEVRQLMGKYIWGAGDDAIETVIGARLAERGQTLAVMESFTGGLLTSILSAVPDCGRWLKAGIVLTCGEGRAQEGLRVACGSGEEEAREMAAAARARQKADIGLGVSGAPEEGERGGDNAWVAIDDGRTVRTILRNYPHYVRLAKQRASYAALFELRDLLAGD
jgi:nicotinamide-nucleotide amidase